MAHQGATLQTLNNEMVTCLEDLRIKRDEVQQQVAVDEEEKRKIQSDLQILTDRLSRVTESLSRKHATLAEFDKTIRETETAYAKILESSQTLLEYMKRENTVLTHSRHA